ncbi:MAG: ABC transporter substrate-binding protein [Hydrogenovibrio sp.]
MHGLFKGVLAWIAVVVLAGSVGGCGVDRWNSPYELSMVERPVLFSAFSSRPKHLDPVVSYNANEWSIISQVYEPPLQYHYFKRPYTLEPLTLTTMPEVVYLNANGEPVPEGSEQVAFTEYRLTLKPDIFYQPHPAFVKNADGEPALVPLTAKPLEQIRTLEDIQPTDTRTLTAEDYAYAIKRMAVRSHHSPILGTMKPFIVGLENFSEKVSAEPISVKALRKAEIPGVQVVSERTLHIRIHGVYPQFIYWLSMNFFAPIPWEAEVFYDQPGLVEKNISLDTYPVGTGPYQLVENDPNRRMRLVANPNYHHGVYPSDGLPEGANPALLKDANHPLPFIQEVIYSLEKESVPLWNKFLQGYYDASGVSSDSFDQAISVSSGGDLSLTDEMTRKGIRFLNVVEPSIFYFGFNMLDPVVGGYSEKQRKLRQAISIALNNEEYISIFLNGRGVAAQGPIPPGIFGHQAGQDGLNPFVYDWQNGHPQRKSIEKAKRLLAEAGYPNGRKPNGEPLVLHYDTAATGPNSKSQLNWYRKQFAQLGIELVIRATDYNRFQDKMRTGQGQMFSWGWNADYPDPENFLFLLDGAQSTVKNQGAGINYANYDNPEFNRLFEQIKTLSNGPERLSLIRKMVRIAQEDAPWSWGFNPKSLALYHHWYHNVWANPLANNTLKYKRLDAKVRAQKQAEWNAPVLWPLWLLLILLVLAVLPLRRAYVKRQQARIHTHDMAGDD